MVVRSLSPVKIFEIPAKSFNVLEHVFAVSGVTVTLSASDFYRLRDPCRVSSSTSDLKTLRARRPRPKLKSTTMRTYPPPRRFPLRPPPPDIRSSAASSRINTLIVFIRLSISSVTSMAFFLLNSSNPEKPDPATWK